MPSAKKKSAKAVHNHHLHATMLEHHAHVLDLHSKIDALHKKIIKHHKDKIQFFDWDDFAQQLVGALIVSLPFSITEEIWLLARNLSWFQLGFLVFLMFLFDTIITHYTSIRKVRSHTFFGVPWRVISLVLVSYGVNLIVLFLMGILGTEVVGFVWAVKVLIVLGFFSSIGASTVDLVK